MPSSHYRAIIFDYDDTLVRTQAIKWAHHKATAKEFYGLDLTDDILARHWGMPFNDMIKIFYQNADTLENMRTANFSLEHRFPKTLQPHVLAVINRLHAAGYLLGILSAMTSDVIEPDMIRLGFNLDHFLFIQGSEETSIHKPDPGVFAPALARLARHDLSPSQILYVGDTLADFEAARGAGLDFIGVTTGLATKTEFASVKAKTVPNLQILLNTILTQTPKSA